MLSDAKSPAIASISRACSGHSDITDISRMTARDLSIESRPIFPSAMIACSIGEGEESKRVSRRARARARLLPIVASPSFLLSSHPQLTPHNFLRHTSHLGINYTVQSLMETAYLTPFMTRAETSPIAVQSTAARLRWPPLRVRQICLSL